MNLQNWFRQSQTPRALMFNLLQHRLDSSSSASILTGPQTYTKFQIAWLHTWHRIRFRLSSFMQNYWSKYTFGFWTTTHKADLNSARARVVILRPYHPALNSSSIFSSSFLSSPHSSKQNYVNRRSKHMVKINNNNDNSVHAASESNTPVKPLSRESAMWKYSQCPLAHKQINNQDLCIFLFHWFGLQTVPS